MPYGTPQGPASPQYALTFRSTTLADGYPVTFQVAASTESMSSNAVAGLIQAFVDTVHTSTEFSLANASRTTTYSETLTPTPVT